MKDEIIVIVVVTAAASDSQDTGIRSRTSTRSYSDGWERIFGQKPEPKPARPN